MTEMAFDSIFDSILAFIMHTLSVAKAKSKAMLDLYWLINTDTGAIIKNLFL